MNISSFTSPGTDRFGRKYPIKITFNDNRILYGHIKSSLIYDNTTTNIHFLIIMNIDDWVNNINEENREVIVFNDDVIDTISNYKSY